MDRLCFATSRVRIQLDNCLGRLRPPRRCVAALMMFAAVFITEWDRSNVHGWIIEKLWNESDVRVTIFDQGDLPKRTINLGTISFYSHVVVAGCMGILLLYVSSYKLICCILPTLAFLNLLAPLVRGDSWSIVVWIVAKSLETATKTSVLCILADWAPPAERTRLLAVSFYPWFLQLQCIHEVNGLIKNIRDRLNIQGAAALYWTLFWMASGLSGPPENDSRISEKESSYLRSNIPAPTSKITKLTEVPWAQILLSKPLAVLCFLCFKTEFSLYYSDETFTRELSSRGLLKMYRYFLLVNTVVYFASCIICEKLINNYRAQSLTIRKSFICGALLCQVLIWIIVSSLNADIFHYAQIAVNSLTLVSLAGFLSMTLDLSLQQSPIVAGLVFFFQNLGYAVSFSYEMHFKSAVNTSYLKYFYWLDASLALFGAFLTFWWASADEQSWSFKPYKSSAKEAFLDRPRFIDLEDSTTANDI